MVTYNCHSELTVVVKKTLSPTVKTALVDTSDVSCSSNRRQPLQLISVVKGLKGYSCVWRFIGNPSQSYGASLAVWDHTVLPATRHKRTRPVTTPAKQAGTQFTYPGRTEGWVDLGSLIATRPGIEPMTAWSQVWQPNHYHYWCTCSSSSSSSNNRN